MKFIFIFLITMLFTGALFITESCRQQPASTEIAVKSFYKRKATVLLLHLDALQSHILAKAPATKLEDYFLKARLAYKRIEAITEYFFQGLTKRINGPALPDVKTEDGVVWAPHGFQVIEQLLYSSYSDTLAASVVDEIQQLKTDISFTISSLEDFAISAKHLQELVQHQLIRIAAMGVTGFDAPLSKLSLQETIAALEGIDKIIGVGTKSKHHNFITLAKKYIEGNNNFDSFNRLHFLTAYLMPLSDSVVKWLPVSETDYTITKPFKGGLTQLLKGNAFNADFYTHYAIGKTNDAKLQLGKKLFFDPILSRSGTVSCGSCHKPEMYFTDGKTKAGNFIHGGFLQRNTPSLYYAALQNNQFFDVRSTTLEDQADEVMKSADEFNLTSDNAAKKLLQNSNYRQLFTDAFATKDSVSSFYVRNAIACYVRSLSPFTSPFDEYLNGNKKALSTEAINGFNLFTGKAKCATCHFIPLFNGNVPPWYNKSESEIIGVPQNAVWQNAVIDTDSGRYKVNAFTELLHAFKTPTIRNVAKTAPYMHNGVYNTLDEVVEFYHKGGGVGLGINLPFQSLPFDSLQLNNAEKKAIVAFMHSLTDKVNY
jgi:cytochrome c peroxidase